MRRHRTVHASIKLRLISEWLPSHLNMLPKALLGDFHKGYEDNYGVEDFERAAQSVQGDRYIELKALSASPAQICNEFGQHFFSGLVTETSGNNGDISLLLAVSTDIYVGQGSPIFCKPADKTALRPCLAELMVTDIKTSS